MIRIYYMQIDSDCSDEQSLALYRRLPDERKESVNRAKNSEIAKKRLYTGAFLQYVLSKETGIPAEQLRYRYNEWGKPELDVAKIYFNLSHSGDYVVLAVSDRVVGIDIEHKTKGYESLAKRFFCEAEYQDIISQWDEMGQKRCFLEYWTMKEAYIKCKGEGMRIPLNSFEICRNVLSEKEGIHISEEKKNGMQFITAFFDKEYCVSVCSELLEDSKRLEMQGISFESLLEEFA